MFHRFILKNLNIIFCLIIASALFAPMAVAQAVDNIVNTIIKAPIGHSGDVAGQVPDFVMVLNISNDPYVEGRSLKKGKTIRVVLPPEMLQVDVEAPFIAPPPKCPTPSCNSVLGVQGWPQKAIPFNLSSSSFEAPNTIVFTALEDIGPGAAGPGIKAIHLNLGGFRNPAAGSYEVKIMAETGPNGAMETGSGMLNVLASTKASINGNSTLSDKRLTNLMYQRTSMGEETPLPFDFTMWDANAEAMVGVTVSEDGKHLIQGNSIVGDISWEVPTGSQGYSVYTKEPSKLIDSTILKLPTGHLRVHFKAGDTVGDYAVTFSLRDGTSQTMRVYVNDANMGQRFTRLFATTSDPKGNNSIQNCGHYPNAKASLDLVQTAINSEITISISDAMPNMLYTAWLRLQGNDLAGNKFGGSPLTGAGSTPLAASTELPALLAATGAGNGTPDVANGVVTDVNGNGVLRVSADFLFDGGVYPFQNFADFDASDERFPIDNPLAIPVAIVMPNENVSAPFGIRVASHCTDGLGHGLTAGAREPWFDFPK